MLSLNTLLILTTSNVRTTTGVPTRIEQLSVKHFDATLPHVPLPIRIVKQKAIIYPALARVLEVVCCRKEAVAALQALQEYG